MTENLSDLSDDSQHQADIDFNAPQGDVLLVFANSREKELLPNLKLTRNQQGDIDVKQLVQDVKNIGFNVEKNMVSFFEPKENLYVHVGVEPEYRKQYMPVTARDEKGRLLIKFRLPSSNEYTSMASRIPTTSGAVSSTADMSQQQNRAAAGAGAPAQANKNPSRRTKERKIGFIIEKVAQWRKLYNGYTNKNGEFVRLSLDEAAQKVGISKKSLDDYLLQLRFGRKFGFNFNHHKDDKVGTLRAFVKKHKKAQSENRDAGATQEAIKEENQQWNGDQDGGVYQDAGFQKPTSQKSETYNEEREREKRTSQKGSRRLRSEKECRQKTKASLSHISAM